ncbi:aspartate/glutamate racemase family protein [Stackebrandtia soli]|uniref:aspartate/glutamate racemase family protein n=1 Tax=Stackebrandtia soli TaxID=1892856 RepID=UPI0039E859AB
MRTIGLIGGMSWESSAVYYRLLNERTRLRLGGHHNARSLMYTVDFADIEHLQRAGDWGTMGDVLADAADRLTGAGAELVALCTNTMHLVADRITERVDVPFVHIVDATADALRADGVDTVGLLATRYTMEHGFYAERMRERGVTVVVPGDDDRTTVHDVIYEELTQGVVTDVSRDRYRGVIERLATAGAKGVILGCTEIGLLIGPDDASLPVYDSASIHVDAILDAARVER